MSEPIPWAGAMRVTGLGHASVLTDTAHGSILTTDSAISAIRR